jgi:peptidoglycan/LPS O-acetylase OafA/YrhL
VILTPLVLLVGLSTFKPIVHAIDKVGDISYGVYIYGFPIQQLLMNYFEFTPIELMMVSLPLSIMAGYASWHLIEKKFLRLKKSITSSSVAV